MMQDRGKERGPAGQTSRNRGFDRVHDEYRGDNKEIEKQESWAAQVKREAQIRRKEAGDQSRKKYDMTQLLNAEHERVVPESNPYGYYCFKQSHKYKGDRGFVFEGRTPFTYTPTQCVALHPPGSFTA
jgi:hypothetical protein